MNTINITSKNGLTLKDLKTLIDKCKKDNISDDTEIYISQQQDISASQAVHILYDGSINIYDWI